MGKVTPENVEKICTYQPATKEQLEGYESIRQQSIDFIKTVLQVCPESADRSDAIRKVREARMTANASIALRGLI